MNLRPAISIPLPWLTYLANKIFGKKEGAPKRSFLKPPRSLSVTTEGKLFIGILFLIGIAAINTGNNLLYLVLATLLSLIITSGILSESTLRGIRVTRTLPRRVFKGSPAPFKLRVENRKRFFPSFSFNIKEIAADGVKVGPAYVLKLNPMGEAVKTVTCIFEKRGRHELKGLKVYTKFPFGLFIKGKVEPAKDTVLVYPMVKIFKKGAFPESLALKDTGKNTAGKGSGPGLFGLRDYTTEDDSRFIHWRSAAKQSRLLVKEFEREAEKKIVIILDNYPTDDAAAFEEMIDDCAAIASHYIEKNYSVGLKTLAGEIKPGAGLDHVYRILGLLAVISPVNIPGKPGVRIIT